MPLSIGERIQVKISQTHVLCRNGTIRYIGPLDGTSGQWIGVEWDLPNQGKHNGFHAASSKQIFVTKDPHGGSFVRPEKCKQGISLLRALQDRYLEDVQMSDTLIDTEFQKQLNVSYTKKWKQGSIDLKALRFLGLNDLGISSVGDLTSLHHILQGNCVQEIDLSRSLFTSWYILQEILQLFPNLRIVKCDGIMLDNESFDPSRALSFPLITDISLNWTGISKRLIILQTLFCNLSRLQLAHNDITSFDASEVPVHLKWVLFEGNKVHWNSIQSLLSSPSCAVESLDVSNNDLSTCSIQSCSSLRSIDLAQNRLTWHDLAGLIHLKTLREIVCHGNAGLEKAPLENVSYRMFLIVLFDQVHKIDHSYISAQEREEAELQVLSAYQENESTIKDKNILNQLEALCKKRNISLEKRNPSNQQSATLKSTTTLTLSTSHGELNILKSARVSGLRAKLKRLGLHGDKLVLECKNGQERWLRDDKETLDAAGIQSGDYVKLE